MEKANKTRWFHTFENNIRIIYKINKNKKNN